jgi:hypothetical protein
MLNMLNMLLLLLLLLILDVKRILLRSELLRSNLGQEARTWSLMRRLKPVLTVVT